MFCSDYCMHILCNILSYDKTIIDWRKISLGLKWYNAIFPTSSYTLFFAKAHTWQSASRHFQWQEFNLTMMRLPCPQLPTIPNSPNAPNSQQPPNNSPCPNHAMPCPQPPTIPNSPNHPNRHHAGNSDSSDSPLGTRPLIFGLTNHTKGCF